jgi:hypothetical protein
MRMQLHEKGREVDDQEKEKSERRRESVTGSKEPAARI